VRNITSSSLCLLVWPRRGKKRWFYFREQGYQPYSSGLEPGTLCELRKATSSYITYLWPEGGEVLGGDEVYNSKLQPSDTYWQLNRVAVSNQTYPSIEDCYHACAPPKWTHTQKPVYCAHRARVMSLRIPIYQFTRVHLYSASHSRVAPENVDLQKEQKCNIFAFIPEWSAVVCFGNSQKGSWQHDKIR
jgi:hypothetical protein